MIRSKRSKLLILLALAILFASVILFSPKAHADSELSINTVDLFNDKTVVKDVQLLLSVKNKKLEEQKQSIKEVVDKKTSLEKEVAALKEQVASLDDMFVKIDKYAPDSTGNTYAWGNCTLYAKSRRPDASNSWGNANTWYSNAQAQGWNVGAKAKKGAIATSVTGWLGHVAYVESVSLDGQWVTISEMNAPMLNHVSQRTVYYTEFRYIYELN